MASDQAESLRRLLAPRVTRRIAVVAAEPGAGATTVALGLANALSMQGERVLLVDEDVHGARAMRLAGATPSATLADVLAARVPLAAALGSRPASGVGVLPAGQLAAGAMPDERTLSAQLPDMRSVLIDARRDATGALSPIAATAHNFVIVLRPEATSITAAYACIKRLHHEYACRQFQLVVNLAATEGAVTALARNLTRTASQYLGVEAGLAGYLPIDPLVARALQLGRCVVEAYPAAAATGALRHIASSVGAWPLRQTASPRGMASAVPA
ncbi:MAG: flagellar synthesis regulator MotR [Cupriavidus sp.]|uniref:MinD/ParA family ATP-binding protein n=2 Tax=Cupriavidus pauculus TaxID=82633 RepID=UPI000C4882F4|nr:AAA family ATPase [Cupriavidus pauculus]MBU67084.1 flagellar synthesis regulator MotR [Cupriavidus sp.]UAL03635.1 flagellar synthesis regulator MotR [Cupriavidus pauculus]